MNTTKHHTKLTNHDRDLIAVWFGAGVKIREIARQLHRSPSTISDEIGRNNFQGYYVAIHAQAVSQDRKSRAGKRHPLKDATTYAYVLDKLMQGWSPEQIAGRLALEHGETVISHESIYAYIYADETKAKKLWEY